MYIKKVEIKNIRSISEFTMEFPEGKEAGWHVLIGDNGAGKSTIVRSIALSMLNNDDVIATRENWNNWLQQSASTGSIRVSILKHDTDRHYKNRKDSEPIKLRTLSFSKNDPNGKAVLNNSIDKSGTLDLSTWMHGFSVAFGPFRRFSGGDREKEQRIYENTPILGAHLSIFGEDVALSEAIPFLRDLYIKKLENKPEGHFLDQLIRFINQGELLPHGAKIDKVDSDNVYFLDSYGASVPVIQMSDGFRSILSLTFELIRQMISQIGLEDVSNNLKSNKDHFDFPGVVLVDEIDAHLHPSWQTTIGQWFIKYFPNLQFIVTTHSPLVCRASENGSIWRLAAPGSDQESGEVTGTQRDRLIYGNVLDAYGTQVFGAATARSAQANEKMNRLAELNIKSITGKISEKEEQEYLELQSIFPTGK